MALSLFTLVRPADGHVPVRYGTSLPRYVQWLHRPLRAVVKYIEYGGDLGPGRTGVHAGLLHEADWVRSG